MAAAAAAPAAGISAGAAMGAMMALDVVMSLGANYVAGENIKSQNIINEANTIAENLMRAANNQLGAAKGSLNRYNQSINNQRIAEQTGKSAEVALMNYRRQRDSAQSGDFESQVQFAEQEGAQKAAQAASGLVGGVVDMVNTTSALRKARIQQASADRFKMADYDASQEQGAIMRAGLESMDTDSIIDNLDYSISTFTAAKSGSNVLGSVLGALYKNPQNTANVFSFATAPNYDAFADRAGAIGSGV